MLVTTESLKRVDEHWAVLAVGQSKRDRGLRVADARLVQSAVQDHWLMRLLQQKDLTLYYMHPMTMRCFSSRHKLVRGERLNFDD
jgi:hypothetical protein